MIGDYSKYYIAAFLLTALLLGCLPQTMSAQGIEPPGPNEARSFLEKISSSTNAFLQKIGKASKIFGAVTPFFENAGAKISSWWLNQIKPWLLKQRHCLELYLNQEIKIE